MAAGAELLLFAAGVVVSLAASWLLVSRLERLGERAGFTEAWLGLVAALAADAPEITSAATALAQGGPSVGAGVVIGSNVFNLAALLGLAAVVAGRIALHRRVVLLAGVPGILVAAVCLLVVAAVVSPAAGLALTAVVLVPGIAVLGMRRARMERLPLPAGWSGWLITAVHEEEAELAEAIRPRRGNLAGRPGRRRGPGRGRGGEHHHGAGGHRPGPPVPGRGHRDRRAGAGGGHQLAERGDRGLPGGSGPGRGGAEHRAEQQRDQRHGRAAHPGEPDRAGGNVRSGLAGDRVVHGADRAGAGVRLPDRGLGRMPGAVIIAGYLAFVTALIISVTQAGVSPAAAVFPAGAVMAAGALLLTWPARRRPPGRAAGAGHAGGWRRESLIRRWSAGRMWLLSVLLCCMIAACDAASGPHLILIRLLITGPCCALLTGRWVPTAVASCFALALGVVLGVPDQIFATVTQYAFMSAVAVVGLTATVSAAILQRQHP